MPVIKCKMCTAPLEVIEGASTVKCEYCGSVQTLPRSQNEQLLALYDRANHYRSISEFDRAAMTYESILAQNPTDAEAHWGACLCRYGIEYVEDPRTGKRVPTCHRTQFTSILDDPSYKKALECADADARRVYQEEAAYIDSVQKKILAISSKEDPFDVFICYKETDAEGNRTPDSVLAQDIYYALTEKGHKVFFSRITLEDKLGSAYEPYIFAALNSAKVMLVIGTQPEYFKAVWVKNEWGRYLTLMQHDAKKMLIPCYKGISPYDMPDEFGALQAQDMGKLGWMQDLVRGVEKILGNAPAASTPAVAPVAPAINLRPIAAAIEDQDWAMANRLLSKALDTDPENGVLHYYAYLIKYELQDLMDMPYSPDYNPAADLLFQRMQRYGNAQLQAQCTQFLSDWKNQGIYLRAEANLKDEQYAEAARQYSTLGDYRDSVQKAARAKAMISLKKEIGNEADFYERKLQAAYPDKLAAYKKVLAATKKSGDYLPNFLYFLGSLITAAAPVLGFAGPDPSIAMIWGFGLGFIICEWFDMFVLDFWDFVKNVIVAAISAFVCGFIYQFLEDSADATLPLLIMLALGVIFLLTAIAKLRKVSSYRKNTKAVKDQYKTFVQPAINAIKKELNEKYSKDIPNVHSLLQKIPYDDFKPEDTL
ncbi:MAG: toll/interleukin-1 receptor domain-containing protein [Firmicutes bacterium]|nr:toll/interleukin-1 receptor domain-containing protein [Bacillota bacterium]